MTLCEVMHSNRLLLALDPLHANKASPMIRFKQCSKLGRKGGNLGFPTLRIEICTRKWRTRRPARPREKHTSSDDDSAPENIDRMHSRDDFTTV